MNTRAPSVSFCSILGAFTIAGCGDWWWGSDTVQDPPAGTDTADDETDGDTDDEPAVEPFQHRAFLSASLEFDGKTPLGQPIPEFNSACGTSNDVLNDVTALSRAMQEDDWLVRYAHDRYVDPGETKYSEPERLIEQYDDPYYRLGGTDAENADKYDLLYFSGHGRPGTLFLNFPYDDGDNNPDNDDDCSVLLYNDVRLGVLCGQRAKVLAFSASCVMPLNQTVVNGESICRLMPDLNDDGIADVPMPPECWFPIECFFAQQSAANHFLSFMDSPVVSSVDSTDWYVTMMLGYPVAASWELIMATSSYEMTKNQPITVVMGSSLVDSYQRVTLSNLATGAFLEKLDPTVLRYPLVSFVEWTGATIYEDANGDPVNAWSSPDMYETENCTVDPNQACDDTNPPGIDFAACNN